MALVASQIDEHVGERMRQRRMALGISQGRLGRHLGLTFSQVQKYEKGTNRIGAGRLYLLAMFLGVPIQYFYEGLEETAATGSDSRAQDVSGSELVVLDAFLSIADSDTRQSLLALVRSIGASAHSSVTPRRSAG